MKFVVPVLNFEEKRYKIANGLNLSSYMCIYDSETDKCRWVTSETVTPVGKNWIESFAELSLDGIIVRSINPMAYRLLKKNGIKIYKAVCEDLTLILDSIAADYEIPLFMEEDFENMDDCTGSCTTCATEDTSCATDDQK